MSSDEEYKRLREQRLEQAIEAAREADELFARAHAAYMRRTTIQSTWGITNEEIEAARSPDTVD